MRIQTDDDVYRVDAVWLGPPRLTFPWRVRYVAYALGLAVVIAVMTVQRWLGIGFGIFSSAWALVVAVAVVRTVGRQVDDERPLGPSVRAWWIDVRTPRPVVRR